MGVHKITELTPVQARALNVIDRYIKVCGYAPSASDVGKALKLSKQRGHALLSVLEDKGYIKRTAGVARSVRIVKPIQ